MDLDNELSLDMQVAVKDAIYEGITDDRVLASLIHITVQDLSDGQVFPNPMEEPIFYGRYFKKWVKEAIFSLEKLKQKGNS